MLTYCHFDPYMKIIYSEYWEIILASKTILTNECIIMDNFEILIHSETIMTTHYIFNDQNDYYPQWKKLLLSSTQSQYRNG